MFKALNKIGTIFPLDKSHFLRYLTVRGFRHFFLKDSAQANNIPLCEIDKMALYPYYYMCELPFFYELEELLEKKSETALTYLGPPKTRTELHSSLLEHIKTSEHKNEAIIAYNDTLDRLGHMFGPYSFECMHYAKLLDRVLSFIYQKQKKTFGKRFKLFLFSDHGQCDCSCQFNLFSELDREGLKLGDDYICFVDATLALFWPEDKVVEEKILKILERIKMGKLVDEALQEKYRIRFDDERYGKIIFVLKPGATFLPNFFSPFNAMKGLHGYLPEDQVQKGFLVSNKKFPYPFKHVKDLKNLLLYICASKG